MRRQAGLVRNRAGQGRVAEGSELLLRRIFLRFSARLLIINVQTIGGLTKGCKRAEISAWTNEP